GSGYAANVGVIPALAGLDDAIFSDELNHASIVDGCRLSRATVHRYRHADPEHLAQLLAASPARRKLIVTDTVFSMDGDTAPLAELVELKERYGGGLMVDEAHAAGVFGPNGEEHAHAEGLAEHVDLHLGTFSKAFGAHGVYVGGRADWIRHLVNTCRSLIYSTALPPPAVAVAAAALELVREAHDRRAALLENARRLREGLGVPGSTQIVPFVVGEAEDAVALSERLEEQGVLAVAIRPPTVPPGTARIRFSAMATHTAADVDRVVEALCAST